MIIKENYSTTAGWAVVDDDLADDSEDEKRAERMAERKLAKRRKAATQETGGGGGGGGGAKQRFQLQFGRQEEVPPPRAPQPLPAPIMRAPFQPANGSGIG